MVREKETRESIIKQFRNRVYLTFCKLLYNNTRITHRHATRIRVKIYFLVFTIQTFFHSYFVALCGIASTCSQATTASFSLSFSLSFFILHRRFHETARNNSVGDVIARYFGNSKNREHFGHYRPTNDPSYSARLVHRSRALPYTLSSFPALWSDPFHFYGHATYVLYVPHTFSPLRRSDTRRERAALRERIFFLFLPNVLQTSYGMAVYGRRVMEARP